MSLPTVHDTVTINEKVASAAKAVWDLVRAKRCVAWIGSGLSIPHYLSWERAVEELCDKCLPREHPRLKHGPEGQASPDSLLELSDICKKQNLKQYEETLGGLFGNMPPHHRAAYSYLYNMPLKSRMTTNVDPVLKYVAGPNVVVRSYPDTFQVIHVAETAIFYLHGIAIKNGVPDGSNLIFCNADMERAYGKGSLTSFIEQVLLSFDVLFVGCRLGEDKIDNIFRRLKTIYDEFPENSPRRHRILVDDFDDTRRLESLGIIPIRYPKIDDAHSGLDRVLQSVADMQQQQTIFIAQQRDLEESRSVL